MLFATWDEPTVWATGELELVLFEPIFASKYCLISKLHTANKELSVDFKLLFPAWSAKLSCRLKPLVQSCLPGHTNNRFAFLGWKLMAAQQPGASMLDP